MHSLHPNSNNIKSCFVRHMNILTFNEYEEKEVVKIFGTIIDCHFDEYKSEIKDLGKIVISATKSVYLSMIKSFAPIPTKCHYVFNLREFSRVLEGIFLIHSSCLKDSDKLIRLWVHEMYRVFHDKLINEDDRQVLLICRFYNLLFGDYISKENKQMMYDEVINDHSVISLLEKYIDKYNKESKTRMDLVIFKFIVEHFSRISRILKMTKGHMLLIGVRGSGRHSVVRLSSFVKNYNLHEIKMTSNYSKLKWKNDLKKAWLKSLIYICENVSNLNVSGNSYFLRSLPVNVSMITSMDNGSKYGFNMI
ncbi:dynein heavy chain 3, axonemal-like [Centruroides sculpturatus]|uniref:dynein heavy chain 3, axonemal-like n=1 Tax=Centruroides sculpturatus TaxID=218467 RepID=UPI000C6CA277|nr:dynein heavy chain 3, axonemal-like [Centruroides sculpturatus]